MDNKKIFQGTHHKDQGRMMGRPNFRQELIERRSIVNNVKREQGK